MFSIRGFQKIVKDRIGQLLHYTLTWLSGEQDWYSKVWFYKNSLWPKASLNARLKILFWMISIKPHAYFLNQSLKILFVNLMHAYFLLNRQCSQKPYAEQAPLKNNLNCPECNRFILPKSYGVVGSFLFESFYIEHLISDFVMWKIGLAVFYKCLKNLCFIYRFK